MKIATWDSNLFYGNPNLRWGNPGYLLEPGDPGYEPPVPSVKWNWQGHRAWLGSCQIMVDRGDGKGFVLLCVDTTPNYIDTQAFPANKTVWSYKAIYRGDDAQVGRWSQTVSVSVGG
jgi:hypothetical protein